MKKANLTKRIHILDYEPLWPSSHIKTLENRMNVSRYDKELVYLIRINVYIVESLDIKRELFK